MLFAAACSSAYAGDPVAGPSLPPAHIALDIAPAKLRAPGRPVAIAELRYNDTAGLMALGIPVQPLPDAGELMTRETADPFPGDRFARSPR